MTIPVQMNNEREEEWKRDGTKDTHRKRETKMEQSMSIMGIKDL